MTERLVVIGGDAAGMTAASQARRRAGDDLSVVVVERGRWTSYSACGIPYWVGGEVAERDDLIARSPEEHRDNGIDVRLGTEATEIDLTAGEVEVRPGSGGSERLGFDQLVVATGAVPIRPPLPGAHAKGVFGVQTLEDGAALIEVVTGEHGAPPSHAVVVGGGYIGVEMAEALLRRGLSVVLVDQAPEPMTSLDPDMGRLVREAMADMGITVLTSTPVEGFDLADDGWVRAVVAGGQTHPADLVVLGLGARPNTAIAERAGIALGDSGGLRPDSRMALPGHPGLWAAGDCVEVHNRVSGRWEYVPLGTHANKQGLVAGINCTGGRAEFEGVVGTAVSRVCDLEIARTGLGTGQAAAAGIDHVSATIESTTRAGYLEEAAPITVKMTAEKGTGRLLGAQIVGREGAAKRIDVCALALWTRLTVTELAAADLSYAPPFAPVWDPVLVAARVTSRRLAE